MKMTLDMAALYVSKGWEKPDEVSEGRWSAIEKQLAHLKDKAGECRRCQMWSAE